MRLHEYVSGELDYYLNEPIRKEEEKKRKISRAKKLAIGSVGLGISGVSAHYIRKSKVIKAGYEAMLHAREKEGIKDIPTLSKIGMAAIQKYRGTKGAKALKYGGVTAIAGSIILALSAVISKLTEKPEIEEEGV